MGYFVMNKQQRDLRYVMNQMVAIRSFSLPPHVKLEMPNLSPTMEKVEIFGVKLMIYRVILQSG